MGALAYRISDVGASGAIVVTPIGVQDTEKAVADDSKTALEPLVLWSD